MFRATKRILLFTLLAAQLSLGSADAGDAVAITVDPTHPGREIPSDFSGLSYEITRLLPENGKYYFSANNTGLITLFRTLGVRNLRIGGNTADRPESKIPDDRDIDQFFGFAKAADLKVIYTLRLKNGNPEADAEIAKYIMDHYAPELECFAIGNEPSVYKASNRRGGKGKLTYAAYSVEWRKFMNTVLALAPNAKFCGPNVHDDASWAVRFANDFGNSGHVTLLTEHLYPGGSAYQGKHGPIQMDEDPTAQTPKGSSAAIDEMLSASFFNNSKSLHDALAPVAAAKGLPYRLEEVNSYFHGGVEGASDRFAAALWGLDFLRWWALGGAGGINFHTGDWDALTGTTGAMSRKHSAVFVTGPEGCRVLPLGYGIKAFDAGGHGQAAPLTISSNKGHANLSAYAVVAADKSLYLTIINKEHLPNIPPVKVVIHPGMIATEARAMVLGAPGGNIAAASGIALGGAQIASDGSWNGRWQPLSMTGGFLAVGIPAATAAIINLR